MDTKPWRLLQTPQLDLAVRWPGGRVPVSLIVDDPMPGLNPMIDHEPSHPHRRHIPNDVLRRFADLAERHGIRGKFSVVPWPLALGRIDRPDTLPLESRAALPEFIELVRERIMPRFDLTCEFLTHSWAIDLRSGRPSAETERTWAAHASAEEFAQTIGLAAQLLGDAGLPMEGVTSPWDSGQDNEEAYAAGIALAERRRGRRLGWYFLRGDDGLDVLPRITHRDADAVVVSIIFGAGPDPGWDTQYGEAERSHLLVDPDGGGRVRTLVQAGLPVVLCTHWQSLYGNGSLGGLHALDNVGARLRAHFGDAVEWVPLRRHAELAAACATLEAVEAGPGPDGGWGLHLRTPHPCLLAELELRGRTEAGRDRLRRPLSWNGTPLQARVGADGAVRVHLPLCDGLLAG